MFWLKNTNKIGRVLFFFCSSVLIKDKTQKQTLFWLGDLLMVNQSINDQLFVLIMAISKYPSKLESRCRHRRCRRCRHLRPRLPSPLPFTFVTAAVYPADCMRARARARARA